MENGYIHNLAQGPKHKTKVKTYNCMQTSYL